jgi:acetolactate synthase-1/3 small subunit
MADARQHTIVAVVEDRPGVLNRIVSLFRRRGYNIASLAVGHSEEPNLSRMTFVVEGDETVVEQVTKQLNKLIDVVRVSDISQEETVTRELALIKVKATSSTRSEIIQITHIFRANIVDVAPESVVIEVTGEVDKIDALVNMLKQFGVREIMRTGRIAIIRGASEHRSGGRASRPETEK